MTRAKRDGGWYEGALFIVIRGLVSTPELSNERIEELATLRVLLNHLAARALPRYRRLIGGRNQQSRGVGDRATGCTAYPA
jgi:hypothetical protein